MDKKDSAGKKKLPLDQLMNDLLRASMGSSVQSVPDEDLDRYVADLITKEAEDQRKRYEKVGVSSYVEPSAPSSRPNKRFLRNIIAGVDSQNRRIEKSSIERVQKELIGGKRTHRERSDEDHRRSESSRYRHRPEESQEHAGSSRNSKDSRSKAYDVDKRRKYSDS